MIGRTNAVIGKSQGKWPSADDVQVTYTGDMKDTREIIDAAGNKYVLYELTSSGELSVDKDIIADICLVTAGGNGDSFNNTTNPFRQSLNGGSGGKMIQVTTVLSGKMSCVIGAPSNGNTSITINDILYDKASYGSSEQRYGTGAGAGAQSLGQVTEGDGRTKYVFGDESVYNYPICAGGGGGLLYDWNRESTAEQYNVIRRGGVGGSNGGDGNPVNASMINPETETTFFSELPEIPPVEGGYYGGGNSTGYDQSGSLIHPTAGFTYGSGGGGGCTYWAVDSSTYGELVNGASGMQGVIFIRLLKR